MPVQVSAVGPSGLDSSGLGGGSDTVPPSVALVAYIEASARSRRSKRRSPQSPRRLRWGHQAAVTRSWEAIWGDLHVWLNPLCQEILSDGLAWFWRVAPLQSPTRTVCSARTRGCCCRWRRSCRQAPSWQSRGGPSSWASSSGVLTERSRPLNTGHLYVSLHIETARSDASLQGDVSLGRGVHGLTAIELSSASWHFLVPMGLEVSRFRSMGTSYSCWRCFGAEHRPADRHSGRRDVIVKALLLGIFVVVFLDISSS